MNKKPPPFWKNKPLDQLTKKEWESLCDRCGICCLHKLQDKETGEISLTSVSCMFLDEVECRCIVYLDRFIINPDCVSLSVDNLKHMTWLPDTCAYRCIAEGRDLESWHHLISGDYETVHQDGISVRNKIVLGRYVNPKDISTPQK